MWVSQTRALEKFWRSLVQLGADTRNGCPANGMTKKNSGSVWFGLARNDSGWCCLVWAMHNAQKLQAPRRKHQGSSKSQYFNAQTV
jgi:hypothetical protein